MPYLTAILEEKQREVTALKLSGISKSFESNRKFLSPTRNFAKALQKNSNDGRLRLIAELKKASPSAGIIVEDFKPIKLAEQYQTLGASAFSVLTDEKFFQGKLLYLEQVRSQFELPTLRKDFVIDESQLLETRLIGADAVLLIVAALDSPKLDSFLQLGKEIGLHVLTEVHDEWELERALKFNAPIIGVNNRNLLDFSVSMDVSIRVKKEIPSGVISVSESGIKSTAELIRLESAGFDSVLIGEGLVTNNQLITYWNLKEEKVT